MDTQRVPINNGCGGKTEQPDFNVILAECVILQDRKRCHKVYTNTRGSSLSCTVVSPWAGSATTELRDDSEGETDPKISPCGVPGGVIAMCWSATSEEDSCGSTGVVGKLGTVVTAGAPRVCADSGGGPLGRRGPENIGKIDTAIVCHRISPPIQTNGD